MLKTKSKAVVSSVLSTFCKVLGRQLMEIFSYRFATMC